MGGAMALPCPGAVVSSYPPPTMPFISKITHDNKRTHIIFFGPERILFMRPLYRPLHQHLRHPRTPSTAQDLLYLQIDQIIMHAIGTKQYTISILQFYLINVHIQPLLLTQRLCNTVAFIEVTLFRFRQILDTRGLIYMPDILFHNLFVL